jgi:hypothetical protein
VRSSERIMVGCMKKDIALLKRHRHLLQARRMREEGWPLAEWSKTVAGLKARQRQGMKLSAVPRKLAQTECELPLTEQAPRALMVITDKRLRLPVK